MSKYETVEYHAWENMKQRCYNPNFHQYRDYGGRGIGVCEQWRDSSDAFLQDMGQRPGPGYSLDRIDNNKDYSPDNCRWVTRFEQAINRRGYNKDSGITGVYKKRNKWMPSLKLGDTTYYFGVRDTIEEAEHVVMSIKEQAYGDE